MRPDSDQVQSAILGLLEGNKRMGFNQLLEALGAQGLDVSRPKLSRRLRRLVEAGTVHKSLMPGWPPSTSYSLTSEPSPEPDSLTAPRFFKGKPSVKLWIVTALLGAGLVVSLAAMYWENQRCGGLLACLSSKEIKLDQLIEKLTTTEGSLRRAEAELSLTLDALMDREALLVQANLSLTEKDSELGVLRAELRKLSAKLSEMPLLIHTEGKIPDVRIELSPARTWIPLPQSSDP